MLAPWTYTLTASDPRWAVETPNVLIVAGESTRVKVSWRGE